MADIEHGDDAIRVIDLVDHTIDPNPDALMEEVPGTYFRLVSRYRLALGSRAP